MPVSFGSRGRLVSKPPGSSGRAVRHAGPWRWLPQMRVKPLSILTFALANCPALEPVQLKGYFSEYFLNLADSLSQGSLVFLTPKARPSTARSTRLAEAPN